MRRWLLMTASYFKDRVDAQMLSQVFGEFDSGNGPSCRDMSQAGLFTLRQVHYTRSQIVDPDRRAKLVFDNGYGQMVLMAISQPVDMARAAIMRRANGQAGAQDERTLAR
jgi:hypothetical protein